MKRSMFVAVVCTGVAMVASAWDETLPWKFEGMTERLPASEVDSKAAVPLVSTGAGLAADPASDGLTEFDSVYFTWMGSNLIKFNSFPPIGALLFIR